MTWAEFRRWAYRELGCKLPADGIGGEGEGGKQALGRVLGVQPIGTGHLRVYGEAEQARLRCWLQVSRVLGDEVGGRGHLRAWLWPILDSLPYDGYLVVRTGPRGREVELTSSAPAWDDRTETLLVVPT